MAIDSVSKRREVLSALGFKLEDYTKWVNKWRNLMGNAEMRGNVCHLDFQQYMLKVTEAGITNPDQIGRYRGQYVMGRYGDMGEYTVDNCRFITNLENFQERKDNGGAAEQGRKLSVIQTGKTAENDPGYAKRAYTLRHHTKIGRHFIAVSPDGEVIREYNLKKFCDERGLKQGNMYAVFVGQRKSCKGWTGRFVEEGDLNGH